MAWKGEDAVFTGRKRVVSWVGRKVGRKVREIGEAREGRPSQVPFSREATEGRAPAHQPAGLMFLRLHENERRAGDDTESRGQLAMDRSH